MKILSFVSYRLDSFPCGFQEKLSIAKIRPSSVNTLKNYCDLPSLVFIRNIADNSIFIYNSLELFFF